MSGPCEVWLSAWHRGVTLDGSERVSPAFPWPLGADPTAPSTPFSRSYRGVDLATGALTHRDVQLLLPADAPWPVGIQYATPQPGVSSSTSVLGAGWFNSASPFLVRVGPGQGYTYWLVYGPDAFVDFVPDIKASGKYIGKNSTVEEVQMNYGTAAPGDQLGGKSGAPASGNYVGTNGAGGVLAVRVVANGPDIVQIHLPDGTLVEFFGFDNETVAAARGKLWRYGKGPVGSGMKWAYIGSNVSAANAITDGLDASGRVVKAFDSAGRRYDYSYGASGNNTGRLTEVRVSLPYLAATGATAPLVARVTYGYEGQSDLPAGYLAETTVQTWPEATTTPGTPSTTSPVLTKRFGYAVTGWGALSRIFDYEGCRRAMLASEIDQTSPAAFWASTALPKYLAANVRYGSSGSGNGRVVSAVFDGLVPDGSDLAPSGGNTVWQFSYDMGTAAGISWLRRAVVTTPQTPYGEFIGGAIVEQASDGEAYKSSRWTTQYFDTHYQVGSRVVTTADPTALSGSIPANTGVWATNVVRSNLNGRLIRVHSPANAASYVHGTGGSATDGTIRAKLSAGPVTIYDRSTGTPNGDDQNAAKLAGLVYRVQESVGWSGSANGANKLTLQRCELVEAPEISQTTSRRPPGRGVRLVSASVFPTARSATTNTTQYTETRWQDGTVASLRTKSVKRVPPVVSTANNGSGLEEPWYTMYDPYGRNIGDFSPKKVAAVRVYDDRTGLLVESVTDADVRVPAGIASTYSDVPLLNGSSPWTVAGEEVPYQVTKFTRYDHAGRAVMMTDGTGRISQVVRQVLGDGRLVTATVPYLFSGADLNSLVRVGDSSGAAPIPVYPSGGLSVVDDTSPGGSLIPVEPTTDASRYYAGPTPFSISNHDGTAEGTGRLVLGTTVFSLASRLSPGETRNLLYGTNTAVAAWFPATTQTRDSDTGRVKFASVVGGQQEVRLGGFDESFLSPTGGRVVERRRYFKQPTAADGWEGTPKTNFDRWRFAYDGVGRMTAAEDPTRTSDRFVIDRAGRSLATMMGTRVPEFGFPKSNARTVRSIQYDGGSLSGNNLPTRMRQHHVGGRAPSESQIVYDNRDRAVGVVNYDVPAAHVGVARNNLGQVTEVGIYGGDPAAFMGAVSAAGYAPSGSANGRYSLQSMAYDEHSRPFRRNDSFVMPGVANPIAAPTLGGTPGAGPQVTSAESSVVYGKTGKVSFQLSASGEHTKTERDRVCNVKGVCTTASAPAAGANFYTHATAPVASSTALLVTSQTLVATDPYSNQVRATVSAVRGSAGPDNITLDGSSGGGLIRFDTAPNPEAMRQSWGVGGGPAGMLLMAIPMRPYSTISLDMFSSDIPGMQTGVGYGVVRTSDDAIYQTGMLPIAVSYQPRGSLGPPVDASGAPVSGDGLNWGANEPSFAPGGFTNSLLEQSGQLSGGQLQNVTLKEITMDEDLAGRPTDAGSFCKSGCDGGGSNQRVKLDYEDGLLRRQTVNPNPYGGSGPAECGDQSSEWKSLEMVGQSFPDFWPFNDGDGPLPQNRWPAEFRPMTDGKLIPPNGTGPPGGMKFAYDVDGRVIGIMDPKFGDYPYLNVPEDKWYIEFEDEGMLNGFVRSPAPETPWLGKPIGNGFPYGIDIKQIERDPLGRVTRVGKTRSYPTMPYGGIWRDTPTISLDDLLTDSNVQMGYGPFANIPERTLTDPTSMGGPGGGLGRPVSPFDSLLEFGRRNPNVLLSGIYRGGGTGLGVTRFTPPGDGASLGMIWKEPGPSVFGEAINRPSGFQLLDAQGLLMGPPKPRGYVDFDGAGRPSMYQDPGLLMIMPYKPSAFDLLDPTKYRKPAGTPSWDTMPSDSNRWFDSRGRPRRTFGILEADRNTPHPLPVEALWISAMEGGKVKSTVDFIGTTSSVATGSDWSTAFVAGWDSNVLASATAMTQSKESDEPYDNNGFDRTFGMSKCKDFFLFNATGKNLNGNANLASAAGSSNPTSINPSGGGGGSGSRLSGFESIDTNTESQPGGGGGSPGGPPGTEDCSPSESELPNEAVPLGGMFIPEGGCPPSDNVRIRMFQPTGDGLEPFGQLPRNLSASAAPLDPERRGVPGGLPGKMVPEVSLAGVDAGEGFGPPLRSDVVGAVRDLLAGDPALSFLVEALPPQYPSPELQRQIDELNKPGVTGEIRHDAVSTQNNN
ncbi:MAG: hypothetical protein ACK5QR_07345, partial [bacterium]